MYGDGICPLAFAPNYHERENIMRLQRHPQLALYVVAGLAATLVACGGGSDGGGPITPSAPVVVTPAAGTVFAEKPLVTDVAIGTNSDIYGGSTTSTTTVDANLVNPWGLAFNPAGFSWIANNGTNTSTLYDGNGVAQSLVVTLAAGAAGAARPTGIVFNGGSGFQVTENGVSGASPFIFAGEAGTIAGWSPSVDLNHVLTVIDNGATGAVYKGLAIATANGATLIYATDFHNNRVDVFDASYQPVTVAGGFKDANVPAGYAPFGIQAIGSSIYVSYAKQDAVAHGEVTGAGLGMVSQFDTSGNLLKNLVLTGGALNAPWGLAQAPSNFGAYSNNLLVANFGDGKINAYDASTGKLNGTLSDSTGAPLVSKGLWALAFGNGIQNQPTNTLFYTAGPGGTHGLYGRIDFVK